MAWGSSSTKRDAGAAAEKLDDESSSVRTAAFRTLRYLEPDMLAHYAAAATRGLDDEYDCVRSEARETLRKLEQVPRNPHPAAICCILL